MKREPWKRVVVKLGTNVLTDAEGFPDKENIRQLVGQIAGLKKKGIEIILVSSGAVGAGKAIFPVTKTLNKVVRRQLFSAIGQVHLMQIYTNMFEEHKMFCAQILATKDDFRSRRHYLNMKNCFQALLRDNIVPIVNENDVVAVSELMFTDNDELAGLIASMINAEALIILSNVDGVYDGHPDEATSRVIKTIDPEDHKMFRVVVPSRSSFGRGGMHTKFRIAQKAARVGISTIIANGKKKKILEDIVQGDFTGTRFIAKTRVSNLKKWMAYHDNMSYSGKVYVNDGAAEALKSAMKVSSLLLVGIEKIEGTFQKGDLIQILDKEGLPIGMGMAQYSSHTAAQHIGERGRKPLIHYDYLFME